VSAYARFLLQFGITAVVIVVAGSYWTRFTDRIALPG
jgi:hypothetical protein